MTAKWEAVPKPGDQGAREPGKQETRGQGLAVLAGAQAGEERMEGL